MIKKIKTITISLIAIFILPLIAHSEYFRIETRYSSFWPSEGVFKEIYGQEYMFGGTIDIKIWKAINLWFSASQYNKIGNLSLSKRETEITISPIIAGIKFMSAGKSAKSYIAIGIGDYKYKEISPLGEVDQREQGYIGELGVLVKIIRGLFINIFGSFSYCEVMPQEIKVDIGGINAGIGLGYEF